MKMPPQPLLAATLLIAFAPVKALHANEQNAAPQERFFPLTTARTQAPTHIKSLAEANARVIRPLRSDTAAMHNGAMRADRDGPLIIYPPAENATDLPKVTRGASNPADAAPSQPLPATPAAAGVTAANADPVLDLFNTTDTATLPSFRDALTGRAGGVPMTPSPQAQHRWPLANARAITSSYGYRNDPINQKMEFHNGIDISAPMGTPVLATADGDVAGVNEDAFFGKSITLRHGDGTETLYGHLSAQDVLAGQQVKAGQKIGAVGMSGRVTGAHLHYTVKRDGVTLDPMKLLNGNAPAVATAAIENPSHVYPGSPMVTRPKPPGRSERLIIVR